MERAIFKTLDNWKSSANRKPLILNGARQVGKTWTLKEFGVRAYRDLVYINCDNNPTLNEVFWDYDTTRLLRVFSALSNKRIEPGKTLIVLDEIQETPKALTSLKYFCENAPDYHIAAAGSLLGVEMQQGSGFPVGKVDELNLYPMTFREFLRAVNETVLLEILSNRQWDVLKSVRSKCIELLRQYYYTGGMPEVVKCYVQTHDLIEVRKIQNRILSQYRMDFGKHIPAGMIPKVGMVWDAIPSQLGRENKKFIYSTIKKGARAKDYEDAIQWLINAGLVYKVNRVNKILQRLKFYEDITSFKLFVNDLGLLGAMADVPAKFILLGTNVFTEYKGAFTEQYVAQQIIASGNKPFYYTNEKSTLEIDFIIQTDTIHPIEVKAEENLRSKSLKTIVDNHDGLTGWRFSMADYREQEWLVNVPLYAIEDWVEKSE